MRSTWQTKGYFTEAFTGHVLQKTCSRIFGKFDRKTPVQEPISKLSLRLQTCNVNFKRGSCIGFFLWNVSNSSELLFYGTSANHFLSLIWKKIQKKLPSRSPALLGLNLMGFTDLFYKEISFHFFKEGFFTQPVT